jgi:UDP-N-acetylglucosamine 2-epimerase (non-hydrolysing)
MKLMVLFGTRPEIIRLSLIIKRLDCFCEQILVHTGQNYDAVLSDIFFTEMGVRLPNLHLGVRSTSYGEQIGQIIVAASRALDEVRPDRVLILGDTNSGLAGIVAARRGIPVFHLEAGNRCYDDRVGEEINRRVIDHVSSVLLPYTHRSKENLLREGIERDRIFVVGNPIQEVLIKFEPQIRASNALDRLKITPSRFFLATIHRAENVDHTERLAKLLEGFSVIADAYEMPVIISTHPRTADQIQRKGLAVRSERVRLLKPMGFFDFVNLERNAYCVLTDSGTAQEECCIMGVPNVTVRDVTERAETMECGSTVLSGADPSLMLEAVGLVVESTPEWRVPSEYLERHVSRTVTNVLLGFTPLRKRG